MNSKADADQPYRAIIAHAQALAEDMIYGWDEFYTDKTESPIERIFLVAFVSRLFMYSESNEVVGTPTGYEWGQRSGSSIVILPQASIGKYRVDFLIAYKMAATQENEPIKYQELIVECDGHDFHDRTKEQAQRDKARDRKLQSGKRQVFRFTGSELFRKPVECAAEVFDYIDNERMAPLYG